MLQYIILDMVKHPFVIYKDTFSSKCCLEPRQGNNSKKSMIISLPRSGVHLMQEMFNMFGLQHARVSHDKNSLHDYRFLTDDDRIKFSRLSDNYAFPFSESYKWVLNGQYVHNHLKYDDHVFATLQSSDLTVYLLKRDLRSCIVSHARQKQKDGSSLPKDPLKLMNVYITLPYYKELFEIIKMMMPWYTNKTFETIKFEDLIGQSGINKQYEIIMRLIEDFEITYLTMDDIINKCINKNTFSFSGKISEVEKYWNDDVEKWFEIVGFKKLNLDLGYETSEINPI